MKTKQTTFSIVVRSLIFNCLFIAITILWALACTPFLWTPYRFRYWLITRWCAFVLLLLKWVCQLRYQIKGMENLPNRPLIFLSQHQSAWETAAFNVVLKRPVAFVFKKELLYIPFFGWAFAALNMIGIDRKQGRHAFSQLLRKGQQCLDRGQSVIVFPEGTRQAFASVGTYKRGGAQLAIHTKTPVASIALDSGKYWPKQGFLKYPGTIQVNIGAAIDCTGKDSEQITEYARQWALEHTIS